MIEVTFRDRRSGETIVRSLNFEWKGDDPAFWWRDGNGACDGNRSLIMYNNDRTRYIDCDAARTLIVIDSIVYEGAEVYQDPPAVRGDGSDDDQRKAQLDSAVRQLSNVQAALIDVTLDLASELAAARHSVEVIGGTQGAQHLLPMAQSIVAAGGRIAAAFASSSNESVEADIATIDGATEELVRAVEPLLDRSPPGELEHLGLHQTSPKQILPEVTIT